MTRLIVLVIVSASMAACSTTSVVTYPPIDPVDRPDRPAKITVFLDGTANDQGSRTNVARLYELITNQDADDHHIVAFYTEGVGSDGRLIGAVTGWGIGHDVREAYKFLARHYRTDEDEIYIFGFSRGAFAARILAGWIHSAGLSDMTGPEMPEGADHMISDLYDAYKGDFTATERTNNYKIVDRRWSSSRRESVSIRFMGLWDTIEALGTPDYEEDFVEPNGRYIDQICNIEEIAHAVALDDNRADLYTPILFKGDHLNEHCPGVAIEDRVSEVWFSGAHADVGGGYKEGNLPGVSLNWMLGKLRDHDLVPRGARVRENPYDVAHDAEAGNFLYEIVFGRDDRDIPRYADGGILNVHESVIMRLKERKARVEAVRRARLAWNPELNTHDSRWYREEPFGDCFVETSSGFRVREPCRAIEVIE